MVECCGRVERDQAAVMAASFQFYDDLYAMRYRAHERYVYGWTDPRGLCSQAEVVPDEDPYDISTDFLTNFMGMVIVMIPVTVITYWLWPWF